MIDNDNTVKTIIHTLLSFHPFSRCFAHPSPAPLAPMVGGLTRVVEKQVLRKVVSVWCPLLEEYDVHDDGSASSLKDPL